MGRPTVSRAVVEVGPRTVRGPGSAPPEWISVAIECVDDEIALLDGRLVEVGQLWSDLLDVVCGECSRTLVLVFPTWWSSARIERVTGAARVVTPDVVVLQRASILGADGVTTVVELSEDFVVISAPDDEVKVLTRDARDVDGYLRMATGVLIDVPAEVPPPQQLSARLHADGIAVLYSDRQRVLRSVSARWSELARSETDGSTAGFRRRVVAVVGGAIVSLSVVGGGWVAQTLSGGPPADSSTALLVEGRVAVWVPAHWAVERITSGPGSARVRVSAPAGEATALHLTQSAGATPTTLAEVAETLRRALESERPGVFVGLDPAGSVGGRPAVTYRELRADSETSWAVVIDGAIRVAIGCQSPPGQRAAINEACVRAVQSAHVVR